jgi:homoserine trans-succinylase
VTLEKIDGKFISVLYGFIGRIIIYNKVYTGNMRQKIIKAPDLRIVADEKYVGKWVVLSSDYKKVLATSDSFPDLEFIKDRRKVVMKVLPANYIPIIL